MHESIFHVLAQSGHEVKSLLEKQMGKRSRDVATISKELAPKPFDHGWNRSPIIDIAWRQATGQQLSLIVDRQVQLKTKESPHTRFASLGVYSKDAMLADPFGITHVQRRRINEANASTGPISALQIGQGIIICGISATKRR